MRRLARVALLGLVAIVTATAAHADHENDFRLGILPFADNERLVRQFTPLVNYLERALDRPVQLSTAPNIRQFIMRLDGDHYDAVIATAHVAALSVADYGYMPVVRSSHSVSCVVYAPVGRGIATVADLRGHRLATPGALSLPAILVERALADRGLEPGRDYTIVHSASNPSALLMAISGQTDAAVALDAVAKSMSPDVRDRLVPLMSVQPPFHAAIVVAPHIAPATADALQRLLLSFRASPEGKRYAELSSGLALVEAAPADFAPFRASLPLLRMRLAATTTQP